ncbi:uncharacterized protein BO97DRAFT_472561 [Aspergillus homomorphus CBS 101889]|uniref:Arylsulfotransferase n=1 Tax=Aspergillus homomorphus (strain CBS 101889) TaxID=1450537 RepID=A0A395HN27_ASPHC|nr:hypothetical protein BO97DRAFT_472561 [Aspergillus homomorphus CBS 101889]RAL09342.1 hypothetical protein BO97DRAFT_472561 [Aspergillus homomorphus CBS 101889]
MAALLHGLWYEHGLFGSHLTLSYESIDIESSEVLVKQWGPHCEEGYVFLSPRGHSYPEPAPLIYDYRGNLVWMGRAFGEFMDLKIQQYKGQDYLTFWAGEFDGTRGIGQYYMVDGGIYDSLFQGIEVETGELLFEWRASDHYAAHESYFFLVDKGSSSSPQDAYDYCHINSIDKHPEDGSYLISSRYMHSVICISATGETQWVLGGNATPSGHDARWYSEEVLTLLDNGAHEHLDSRGYSRRLMIQLEFDDWTADTLHVYDSPGRFSSHSHGSLQVLSRTGNTDCSVDGDLLCKFHWGPRKSHWIGRPRNPPDVEVDENSRTAYVSWNGATDVAGWALQRASNGSDLEGEFESIHYGPKEGFETAVGLVGEGYFLLVAVDFEGNHMGATRFFEAMLAAGAQNTAETIKSSFSIFSEGVFQLTLLVICATGALSTAVWTGRRRLLETLTAACQRFKTYSGVVKHELAC